MLDLLISALNVKTLTALFAGLAAFFGRKKKGGDS